MKKVAMLLVMVFVLSFTTVAAAIDFWKMADQATVGWDRPPTFVDGSPVTEDINLQYLVFIANKATDPEKLNPILLTPEPISDLELVITLIDEGQFLVGAQTIRVVDGLDEPLKSGIAWSDDPDFVENRETFGILYYKMPMPPVWRVRR